MRRLAMPVLLCFASVAWCQPWDVTEAAVFPDWPGEFRILRWDPAPYLKEGAIMAPTGEIAAWMGLQASFDRQNGAIVLRVADEEPILRAVVGEKRATVLGKERELAWPADEKNGVTYLPLRWLMEAFGMEVVWNPLAAEAVIFTGEEWCKLSLSSPLAAGKYVDFAGADHHGEVVLLALSADGGKLGVLYSSGRVEAWDVARQECVVWDAVGDDISASESGLTISPDGRYVAVATPDVLLALDTASGRAAWRKELEPPEEHEFVVALADDASAAAACLVDHSDVEAPGLGIPFDDRDTSKRLEVYALPGGRRVFKDTKPRRGVMGIAVSRGGRFVIVGCGGYFRGRVRVLDTKRNREKGVGRRSVARSKPAARLPCGSLLTLERMVEDCGFLRPDIYGPARDLWQWPGEESEVVEWGQYVLGAPSHDGARAVVAEGIHAIHVHVLDTESGERVWTAPRHLAPCSCAAVSDGARVVATGCVDGTVSVWHTTTGRQLLHLNKSDTIVEISLRSGATVDVEMLIPRAIRRWGARAVYNDEQKHLPPGLGIKTLWVRSVGEGPAARARVRVSAQGRPGQYTGYVLYKFAHRYECPIYTDTWQEEAAKVFRVHVLSPMPPQNP